MDNLPDFIRNAFVEIIVALIGAVVSGILAIISNTNDKKREATIFTALSVFIFVIIFLAIGFAFVSDMYSLSQEKVDILVANVDGIETQQYRVAEFIREQLRKPPGRFQSTVIGGERIVTEAEGGNSARELGSKWRAKIVVWGWYSIVDEFYLQLNMEMVNRMSNSPRIDPSIKIVAQTMPDSLGAFVFQKRLGKDLSSTVYGMYCYALADWDCAIEFFGDAITNMNSYIFTYDNPGVLYQYRGGAFYFKEDYELAIADFEAARLYHSDSLPYYVLGLAYEKTRRTVSAFNNYSIAAEDYDDPNAYERLAIMAGKLNDPKQAVAYFEKAVEGNDFKVFGPSDSDEESVIVNAYFHEGMLSKEAEDYESALKMFDRIIVMDYEFYDAYFYRGEVYMHLNQPQEAIADFDKYMKQGTNPDLKAKAKVYGNYLKYPDFKWFFDWYYK